MKRIFVPAERELSNTAPEKNGKYPSEPKIPQRRWNPLIPISLGLVTNAAIWGIALLYLKLASPNYTSDFSVSLPVTSTSTNINLPNIGQASSQNKSPYEIQTQDPRENYKFIATGEEVINEAAKQTNLAVKDFGKPRVEIVDNTTLMTIEIKGDNPEQAQSKALALYEAFEARLEQLRNQEIAKQDIFLKNALNTAQERLKLAESKLSQYKASSGLSSLDQITNLSTNIEQLRRQRAEVLAQQQQASGTLAQLSANLRLSGQDAGDALNLQTDPLFQKYVQDYSLANGIFVGLNAKFLPTHPAVIDEKAKLDAARSALLNRANTLLGKPVTLATLSQLNLTNSNSQSSNSNRADLAQQLMTVQAEQKGLQAQAQSLERQIAMLENRHKLLAQKEVYFEELKRDLEIAEAVFSSTLARLDLAKSNIFASYPQVHMLAEPSLPKSATSPKKIFVLIGAGLGSLFCTSGITLLWLRKNGFPQKSRTIVLNPQVKPL